MTFVNPDETLDRMQTIGGCARDYAFVMAKKALSASERPGACRLKRYPKNNHNSSME